ncbi:MAG TPA: hypothetical protein VFK05_24775 [Polyangiaceae bacterium]|nr:hypothetical protein [Polyangiaceae bacterium]
MFVRNSDAPGAPTAEPSSKADPVHLLLVQTPDLTQRGRAWLERAHSGAFDGRELQRLIRLEKLSLG